MRLSRNSRPRRDGALDRCERGFGAAGIGAAGLRHVGPAAAALAAQASAPSAHQIDRVEARGEIVGDADHDRRLAVRARRPAPRRPSRYRVSDRRRGSSAPWPARRRATRPANLTPPRSLASSVAAALPPPIAASRRASVNSRSSRRRSSTRPSDARRQLGGRGLERVRGLAQQLLLVRRHGLRQRRRSAPRCGARPTATALSPTILKKPMSPVRRTCVPPQSSTEYGRGAVAVVAILAHRDDAHLVAVFLAEQRHRAGVDRALGRHQPRRHLGVLADAGVDLGLDRLRCPRGRQRARMAEIEAQPVGRDAASPSA